MSKSIWVFIVITNYANEGSTDTIEDVFSTRDLAKAWIKKDKKRVREQDLIPYDEDYQIKKYKLINK
jgi:hypothetical protein